MITQAVDQHALNFMVSSSKPAPQPSSLEVSQADFLEDAGTEHTGMHQRLSRFLEILGASGAENSDLLQPLPDVLFIDEAEFNRCVSGYVANHPGKPIAR